MNFYYFWVKNSVFLPELSKSVVTRKNTTSYISNIISNPYSSGFKYFAISDKNSLITFNVKNTLANSNIVLNVDYAKNNFDADKHSVWKLISEGDPTEVIPTTIENKWYDSLIGSDTSGNLVPDLDLATNRKYGNLLRPRQSWYVNRFDALKQVIDYANTVLKKNQLANTINRAKIIERRDVAEGNFIYARCKPRNKVTALRKVIVMNYVST